VREKLWARAELPERSVAEGAKIMGEAVVKIEAAGGQGSGFVTHVDGWVVTNFHVVEREVEVDVVVYSLGKQRFRTAHGAQVQGRGDQPADGPRAREDGSAHGSAIEVGVPRRQRRHAVGDTGLRDRRADRPRPHGLSSGIISVTNRTFEGRCHFQITTPINPGNSGGRCSTCAARSSA
jgi:S1-C subfamily serine protease